MESHFHVHLGQDEEREVQEWKSGKYSRNRGQCILLGQSHLILWSFSFSSQSDFFSIQTLAQKAVDIPLLCCWSI